jgi:hypothetical protein
MRLSAAAGIIEYLQPIRDRSGKKTQNSRRDRRSHKEIDCHISNHGKLPKGVAHTAVSSAKRELQVLPASESREAGARGSTLGLNDNLAADGDSAHGIARIDDQIE